MSVGNLSQQIWEILGSFKVGAVVSAALVTNGTQATLGFNWIPPDISKLASLIGIIVGLSIVTVNILTQYRAWRASKRAQDQHVREIAKLDLELEHLKKTLKDESKTVTPGDSPNSER